MLAPSRQCGDSRRGRIALGGVGYMAAWAIAPLEQANLIAVTCLGGAVIVVAARASCGRSRG
jgi:hypothetical protein